MSTQSRVENDRVCRSCGSGNVEDLGISEVESTESSTIREMDLSGEERRDDLLWND